MSNDENYDKVERHPYVVNVMCHVTWEVESYCFADKVDALGFCESLHWLSMWEIIDKRTGNVIANN